MKRIVIVSGTPSSGKTQILKHLLPLFREKGERVCAAKMDTLYSPDTEAYEAMGIPSVLGLSGDICPDHFLVSNLPELWHWGERKDADYLFIESAGLCHRGSPLTEKAVAVTALDVTANAFSPSRMGPMVLQADVIVMTKCDLISQAEREILAFRLASVNRGAKIIAFDGREGYGAERILSCILSLPPVDSYENDILRHTMPSGVCSYCVGERRVGSEFQLGVVGKIDFGEDKDK